MSVPSVPSSSSHHHRRHHGSKIAAPTFMSKEEIHSRSMAVVESEISLSRDLASRVGPDVIATHRESISKMSTGELMDMAVCVVDRVNMSYRVMRELLFQRFHLEPFGSVSHMGPSGLNTAMTTVMIHVKNVEKHFESFQTTIRSMGNNVMRMAEFKHKTQSDSQEANDCFEVLNQSQKYDLLLLLEDILIDARMMHAESAYYAYHVLYKDNIALNDTNMVNHMM